MLEGPKKPTKTLTFQVVTVAGMNVAIYWDVSCSLVDAERRTLLMEAVKSCEASVNNY
jgi:hypothetical protein